MRIFFTLSLFAALAASGISSVLADPVADLTQMRDSFLALHSFHAEITTHSGTVISVDSIRPDKMRASTQGMEGVQIGSTTWAQVGGQWHVFPGARNVLQRQTA
ncbi:MAG TPA: hypothetical protein VGX02_10310, partial [Candidatus Eremiobacteraceae bacterium]|nr:hypothetical protein [Candidatus Eremiobacteraceae bacterium]